MKEADAINLVIQQAAAMGLKPCIREGCYQFAPLDMKHGLCPVCSRETAELEARLSGKDAAPAAPQCPPMFPYNEKPEKD